MARSIWTGVISFGLVSVPVAMYPATREHEVSFHQFEKGTGDRIRYQRINERTGKEVDFDDIVKGADVGGGEYVMIDPDELDEIAPGRSRSLEIHRFVDLDRIDPIYYQKTYYLGPDGEAAGKSYALLRDAMSETNMAAIGTLVMRGKEYLTAIRPDADLLVLETLFFADEVRDAKDVLEKAPGRAKAKPQELKMATQLVESMAGDWNPKDYTDTYTDRVKDLIDAKKTGGEVTMAEEAPAATQAKDLMDVLRRSVEAARSGSHRAPASATKSSTRKATAQTAPAKKSTARKAPAKKSTAKKAPARKAAKKS